MNGPLLVILPHNPGDVVMALAAVRRIKAALPALPVDYVVSEECAPLVRSHPLLRRVLVIPRRTLLDPWKAGHPDAALAALEGFLADLGAEHYAASLNLFQERSGAFLHAFVRADRKAGLELADGSRIQVGSRHLEHLFAVPAARRDNGWHAVDVYIRAARALLGAQGPWPAPDPSLPWLPPLSAPAGWDGTAGPEGPAGPKGPGPKTFIACHPGSAWPGKRWPEAQWASLAAACVQAGETLVFTGAPEERPVMDRILALLPAGTRVHDWVGRTSLIGAAWIHSRARLSVTGDTVAMHLAAAASTPVVALFGASNPVETGPYGRSHFIFQTQLDLPADFAFAEAHPGLAALPASAVAGFILSGLPPPPDQAALWETARDEGRDMQALRDPRGLLHPHQARADSLQRSLDAGAEAPFPPAGAPPLFGAREAVRKALEQCAGDSPDLGALERAEQSLAAQTRDTLVWEAYRIAINGLPLRSLRDHLDQRRARFALALAEEAAAATTESGASRPR